VVGISFAAAVLAGCLGYWRASVILERTDIERSTRNLAKIIKELHLPAASERLGMQLKRVSGCEIAVEKDGTQVFSTIPDMGAEALEGYIAFSAALDGGHTLRLLKPKSQASELIRAQSLSIGLIAAIAGLVAAFAAWRIAAAYNKLHLRLLDADRRLAKAEQVALAGKISASVVHELRNPLSGIRMNAQILAEDLKDKGMDDDIVGIITREVDRIDAYLSGLSDLDASASPPNSASARLDAVIQDAISAMEGKARHANAGIDVDYSGKAATAVVFCGANELRQILLNLIGNALEAMPEGGRVLVSATTEAGRACISVLDDGPGVDSSQGDIFAPFVSDKPHGCGLGLHICQSIAARYGGNITWCNVPGHGAKFTVNLRAGVANGNLTA